MSLVFFSFGGLKENEWIFYFIKKKIFYYRTRKETAKNIKIGKFQVEIFFSLLHLSIWYATFHN